MTMLENNAKSLRKYLTDAEQKLWQLLRNRKFFGYKFRRQYWITGKYIVDFICLEKKLIIEVDGSQHLEQEIYDNERTAVLQRLHYKVTRYWNHDVLYRTQIVLEDIYKNLQD